MAVAKKTKTTRGQIGPLDRTAGERLGAVKDVPQGVTS